MYAFGPKLKRNFTAEPIMMTDHYNLVCYLLGMNPNPNNGSWSRVKDMLESEEEQFQFNKTNSLGLTSSSASLTSAMFFYMIIAFCMLL